MTDNYEINQKAGLGSEVTQIGKQIVYEGLSPSEACKLATDLFTDNFPKLQAQAMETVNKRVDELMSDIAIKLEQKSPSSMSAFAEPDVQCAIYEAQKSYARFGTKEMLSTLSSLIATRIEKNDNENICLKVAIDKAIEISGLLSAKHLDYLALLFSVTQIKNNEIKNTHQLEKYLFLLDQSFPNIDFSGVPYLNMLGCLQLRLFDVTETLGNIYGFPKGVVRQVCPDNILKLSGDYATSHIGTILAIAHLEMKTPLELDPEIWIHS